MMIGWRSANHLTTVSIRQTHLLPGVLITYISLFPIVLVKVKKNPPSKPVSKQQIIHFHIFPLNTWMDVSMVINTQLPSGQVELRVRLSLENTQTHTQVSHPRSFSPATAMNWTPFPTSCGMSLTFRGTWISPQWLRTVLSSLQS